MSARAGIALWTGVAVFAADQLSKLAVVHLLDLRTLGTLPVWPPYLTLRMAWNTGINFGLFSGNTDAMRWILIAVALVISGWVVWFIRRDDAGPRAQVAAGLLVGGALGNVVDRVVYGAVADFLNMSCCGIDNPYAFNVADIAIFAGAFGLILFSGTPQDPPRNPPRGTRREPRLRSGGGTDRKTRDAPRDPR